MENVEAIRTFARTYFTHIGGTFIEDSERRLAVRIPVEIDKELTDRPYYWMWVEATGQPVEPPTYTFIFDPDAAAEEDDAAEWLAPGSFRLQRMYESACRRGRYIRQFELSGADTPLRPFLFVIWKISYISDRRKDRLITAAVDLIEGRVAVHPDISLPSAALSDRPLAQQIDKEQMDWPAALSLLEAALSLHLSHEDHRWAEEAILRRQEEEQRLARYFQQILREREVDRRTLEQEWAVRREELKWRLGPRILADPLQWAWLFLTPESARVWFNSRPLTSLPHSLDRAEIEVQDSLTSVRASRSVEAGHPARLGAHGGSSGQSGSA